jgi:hypothetical protein
MDLPTTAVDPAEERHSAHSSIHNVISPVGLWWKILPWKMPETRIARNENSVRSRSDGYNTRRANPLVTLFFDGDKKITVAVLSARLDTLSRYFQCRVEQGTAYQRSPLYYEMDGYVRENWTKIQRQNGFGPQSVSIAVGSLKASDDAQRDELTTERRSRKRKTVDDEILLEQALDIARLHRLQDDLDVISISFMSQVNKAFGRVASKLARQRLLDTKLILRPFVDGISLNGYSNFSRRDATTLVSCSESGRAVEYCQREDILLSSSIGGEEFFKPVPSTISDLSWECEELALANLHRWWGDIAIRDYVGQKLILYWKLDPSHPDYGDNKGSGIISLAALRLEAEQSKGVRTWPMAQSSICLDVLESSVRVIDDVTMSFAGRLRVSQVRLNFASLVRAAARGKLDSLKTDHELIEESRPLLEHEIDYLLEVERAALL